jgi:ParB/RepB/Spo0J family partition protein
MRVEKIELAGLRFSDNRTYGGKGDIKILAEDIKQNGLINPITVKLNDFDGSDDLGTYEVIAGRRRVRAVTMLGWKDISCRILEGDEIERAEEIAGSENINRLDMHPLDEAVIFKRLIDNGELIEDMAKRFDRTISAIWQRIQLLDLNNDIKTLFRNGFLTLQAAAMLKGLSENAQKAFCKEYGKSKNAIDDHRVKYFINNLKHDVLYGFLRDRECTECKTRNYYNDKNLFPEMNDIDECCFKHDCYLEKFNKVLVDKIKSLKNKRKTHTNASLITTGYHSELIDILGNSVSLDGIKYKILKYTYDTAASAKDKGAVPCFTTNIRSGKLEIDLGYWKEAEKVLSGYKQSTETKRKELIPVVKLLDLPKEEETQTLEAMIESKRISTSYGLKENVSKSVFDRIMCMKGQAFKDDKQIGNILTGQEIAELFLRKRFKYLKGHEKTVLESFVGKAVIAEISKMSPYKIFEILLAMEQYSYDMPHPDKFDKAEYTDIIKWVGLTPQVLKTIYQEEIRKRIPKQKPEQKKSTEKPTAKKPIKKTGSGKRGMIKT